MGSLREWLQSIGLERRLEKLHGNDIDMDMVASRDDNDLRELGLTLGDRTRFLAASSRNMPMCSRAMSLTGRCYPMVMI